MIPEESANNMAEIPIITQESFSEEQIDPVTKPIATPELVSEWKRWFLIQKFSLDTVDIYFSFIKRFVGYKVFVCQKSVDRFREEHMGSVSSGALKSFFKFLVYKKHFPESLLLIRFEKNKQTTKLPKTITPEEVEKIIAGLDFIKDKLLTQIIYSLALRIGETLKLRWDDFNWSEWIKNKEAFGKVKLQGTKRDKFRVLPVNPSLMEALYNNHESKTEEGIPIGGLVFGDTKKLMELMTDKNEGENLTKEQSMDRNRKHYLKCVKLNYQSLLYKVSFATIGKHIYPHVLRHSKAQWLMDHDTPIETLQGLLGHASIATTQVYAKASVSKIQRDLEKYDVPIKQIIKQTGIKKETSLIDMKKAITKEVLEKTKPKETEEIKEITPKNKDPFAFN